MTECVLDVLNVTCAVASRVVPRFGTHFLVGESSNDLELYSLYITGVVIFLFSVASLLLSRFARWKNKNMNRSENHIDWTKYQLLPIYENLLGCKNICLLIVLLQHIKGLLWELDGRLTCAGENAGDLWAFNNTNGALRFTLFSAEICFTPVNRF